MALLQVRGVPDDVHRAARVEAIEAGVSLRDFVIEALGREVARRRAERARLGGETAAYPVNLDDREEAELWALWTFPEAERWALVELLRSLRVDPE